MSWSDILWVVNKILESSNKKDSDSEKQKDNKTTQKDSVQDTSVAEEKSKINIKTNGVYSISSLSQIDNWLQELDISTSYVNNIIWGYKKILDEWKVADLWQIKNDLHTIYKNPDIHKKILNSPDLINYIKTLPLEKKKDIIKIIAPATLDFSERNSFVNKIFLTRQERKNFIKSIINTTEKKTEDKIKQEIRQYLSNYFLVYELIDTFKPTYTWDTWNPEENRKTRQFFLRRAWIQEIYKDSVEHNEKIRDWFLDVMMGVSRIERSVNNILDENHQKYLENFYINKIKTKQEDVIKNWLSMLDSDTIDKINTLPKKDFEDFLNRLLEDAKNNKKSWESDFSLRDKPAKILWLSVAISKAHKEIDDILSKNNISTKVSTEEIISATEAAFVKSLDQQQKENYYKNRKVVLDDFWKVSRILIEKEGIEEVVFDKDDPKNRTIELDIKNKRARALNNSEINKQLDKIEEKLIIEYKNAGKEDELKSIRWEKYYTEVKTRYEIENGLYTLERRVDLSIHANALDGKAWNDFWNHMEMNSTLDSIVRIKELSWVNDESLLKFLESKPWEQNILWAKKSLEDRSKLDITPVKERLHKETNTLIKDTFVSRVLTFVQDSLDVSIDKEETDNILSQFRLGENQKFQDQKIILEWSYNGKKIVLQYDMNTGNMFYQPYIIKGGRQEISINQSKDAENFEPFAPNVVWPNINGIIDASAKINNQSIIDKSNDISWYKEIYKKELSNNYPITFAKEYKEWMKQQYLKTILAQEIEWLVGVSQSSSQKTIGEESEKKLYNFYKMIYDNTYQRNGKNTTQELQILRWGINKMKDLYTRISVIKDSDAKQIFEKLFVDIKWKWNDIAFAKEKQNQIDLRKSFFLSMDSTPNNSSWEIDPERIDVFINRVEGKSNIDENNPIIKNILDKIPSEILADNFLKNNENAWVPNQVS